MEVSGSGEMSFMKVIIIRRLRTKILRGRLKANQKWFEGALGGSAPRFVVPAIATMKIPGMQTFASVTIFMGFAAFVRRRVIRNSRR